MLFDIPYLLFNKNAIQHSKNTIDFCMNTEDVPKIRVCFKTW